MNLNGIWSSPVNVDVVFDDNRRMCLRVILRLILALLFAVSAQARVDDGDYHSVDTIDQKQDGNFNPSDAEGNDNSSDDAPEIQTDPFSQIEHIRFDNGFQVFLAPSPKAVNTAVRLEVEVGWEAEREEEWGVSHLLEHVLFRNKNLKEEMTYLQLIREAGGEANGTTSSRATSYYGTIPYKKGQWLLQTFTKMILDPGITIENVEKEKGTVELEIGRPSPLAQALGFNPMDYLTPPYLDGRDFWESEFGIKPSREYTRTEEQLSNRRLTVKQVREHYDNYYHPRNMRLFIAGRFNREAILRIVEQKWARLEDPIQMSRGKVLPPLQSVKPRLASYRRKVLTTESPSIYVGTKTWHVSVQDHEVLSSYGEYLAHRLMKEMRNKKGQTYTASSSTENSRGYGYSYVHFQTQPEHLKENVKLVKQHLKEEAQEGQLTDAQVKEAIALYLGDYYRRGQEAENMMQLALWYRGIYWLFGKFESPYEKIKNTTPDEYRDILKKYYASDRRYEFTYEPYYFFYYDIFLFYFAVALGTFLMLRKLMTRKFAYDQIRWVRKLTFPPFRILEGLTLFIAWIVFTHFQFVLAELFNLGSLQSHILIAEYLRSMIWAFAILLVGQGAISLLPRKLMIVGPELVIKSASYYSQHLQISEVVSIVIVPLFSLKFWELLFEHHFRFRFYFFNPLFWQPGLALKLQDGRLLYMSFSNAHDVSFELGRLLGERKIILKKSEAS